MLRSMNDLMGYAIRATDGPIGHVKDLYFDDLAWVVRYLIVDTGSWLSSRRVLISPIAIEPSIWDDRILSVSITTEQVRNSPDIDTHKPVSRQHEMEYLGYYSYPYYWGGAGFWGAGVYPSMSLMGIGSAQAEPGLPALTARPASDAAKHQHDDPHLRSGKAVIGYHIEASDGDIGHVQGLLLDEDTWAVRYLIVDTSNWWLGHQVLIAPRWIRNVSWPDNTVAVDLTRQAIKDAPPYDSAVQLGRAGEIALHQHHERAGYWADEVRRESPPYRVIKPATPEAITGRGA
jgi:hypothetical protein